MFGARVVLSRPLALTMGRQQTLGSCLCRRSVLPLTLRNRQVLWLSVEHEGTPRPIKSQGYVGRQAQAYRREGQGECLDQ